MLTESKLPAASPHPGARRPTRSRPVDPNQCRRLLPWRRYLSQSLKSEGRALFPPTHGSTIAIAATTTIDAASAAAAAG